ncbi:MAG: AbgT family transporter [Ignavibacteriales bacterium]|jgi:aminobenzoyl-glutamate transport protein|nr:AbgT family transporter [Ignavibacteriales bacterium]MBP7542846.1 AbgT family transporter [Ignavibacteriaceae bacterium]MBP9122078.1 AbgT family transporter [Ignavibacteriaceae bacterium]MCC6638662.1 AbgT family transporter [Ignavibacteriaceae bacterium]
MAKNNSVGSVWDKFLNIIEKGGNLLPHPATLFFIFAVLIVAASGVASWAGIEVQHPAKDEMIKPVNLFSIDGIHYILTSLVVNFTSFAPLGTVLVALLGIGVAEGSGLMGTALRLIVLKAPKKILTFVIVFSGVMSNAASEVGYVLLIPLAAIIFLAVGRHPILGIAAAFAGVSGGYSANLLLGTIDPLLAGLSQEAAHIIDKTYMVNPAANYYFMAFSTFLIAGAGTWVTEKIVSPRLGAYTGSEKPEELKPLSDPEKKGLLYALVTSFVIVAVILAGLIPENGFLRDPKTNDILKSPFMSGIVSIIFFGGALAGIAYGIGAKTIRSDSDVMKGMGKAMETLGSYMVLVFFAAQFVAYFNKSNLGLIIAVEGSTLLKSLDLGEIPLMISFVVLTALLNLFMGSASAKWAIMAPVFIPMFMLLGYSPEFTQVAYRVGDSVSNVISPMMSYFALIIAMIQRYDKNAGLGTLISTMIPFTIVFFIIWSLVLVGWVSLDLPLGPGSRLYYP